MKKVFILTLLLVALSFAEGGLSSSSSANSATSSSSEEQMGVESCNSSGSTGVIPPGSCHVNGFVCNLGFDLGEKNVLFFNIGTDLTCNSLAGSTLMPSSSSSEAKFFLIEDEYDAGPLSLTLAGSLAMSATLNGRAVSIVYKRVREDMDYGAIRLLSIFLYNQ